MSRNCIPTSVVPHLRYPYKEFNPAQSLVVPWRDKDVNLICASPTGSGKTEMAELIMDDSLRKRKKVIYAAPMKAIAQEKKKKWEDPKHGFSGYSVIEITSDVQMDEDRLKEIKAADIIVMTTEALDSKCRRMESEKNDWLLEVGALVVDEVHLLTFEERGDRLESAIMRFSHYNPQARLAFLSGTVSNYEELGRWASSLNGKETKNIVSDFRPCPLRKHYVEYEEASDKFQKLSALLRENPDDLFIIFVATKPEGRNLDKLLTKAGYRVAFHSADLKMENREKIEDQFKAGKLDHLIATSTLAYGVNLPARRVVVYGVTRGKDGVHPMDIHQECGRAGRMGYDDEGDAYIFIKEDRFGKDKERIEQPMYVESQMPKPKVLSFHMVSEIEQGNIKTAADVQKWFARSLSSFQGKNISYEIIQQTVSMMEEARAIKRLANGEFHCLPAGRAASWFYHSPFDTSAWRDNFHSIFKNSADPDDFDIAWAIARTESTISKGWPYTKDLEMIAEMHSSACADRGYKYHANVVQKTHLLHQYLSGADLDEASEARLYEFKKDARRIVQTVKTLGKMTKSYEPDDNYWEMFSLRLEAGVSREMLPLVEVDGVGRGRAKKLFEAGIRSLEDITIGRETVEKILGSGVGHKIYTSAMKIIKDRITVKDAERTQTDAPGGSA